MQLSLFWIRRCSFVVIVFDLDWKTLGKGACGHTPRHSQTQKHNIKIMFNYLKWKGLGKTRLRPHTKAFSKVSKIYCFDSKTALEIRNLWWLTPSPFAFKKCMKNILKNDLLQMCTQIWSDAEVRWATHFLHSFGIHVLTLCWISVWSNLHKCSFAVLLGMQLHSERSVQDHPHPLAIIQGEGTPICAETTMLTNTTFSC